ncbi:MAG: S24 family peptidase [Sphingomicrobium sp.]
MVLTDESPLVRDLMRLKPDDLTPNGWAVKAGVSRTVWSDMRRHGNPSRRTLEKLLAAAGSSLAEFEALRIGRAPRPFAPMSGAGAEDARSAGWRPAPLPPVPLLVTAMGGEWLDDGRQIEWMEFDPERIAGRVERPSSLTEDSQAYAVTLVGESMWPRFRPGRELLVSPAAQVEIGDDVLITLVSPSPQGRAMVMIKELVRRTPDFTELRQFNPDVAFKVEASAIAAIHKVVGEAM